MRQGTGGVPEVLPGVAETPAVELNPRVSSVMVYEASNIDVPAIKGGSFVGHVESNSSPVAVMEQAGTARPVRGMFRAGTRHKAARYARAVCKMTALAPQVWEHLSREVGKPTHQLQLQGGTVPVLIQLHMQGSASQAVRVDPTPNSHVLVCGAHPGALLKLLKAFLKLRREVGVQGTIVVPEDPKARYWKLVKGRRVLSFQAGEQVLCTGGVPVPVCEDCSWGVFTTRPAVEHEGMEQEEAEGSLVDESPESPAEAGAADAGPESHTATLPDLSRVLVSCCVCEWCAVYVSD